MVSNESVQEINEEDSLKKNKSSIINNDCDCAQGTVIHNNSDNEKENTSKRVGVSAAS